VIQLCERLDGIPLAIELGAVQLSNRLEHRFGLVTSGRRGGPAAPADAARHHAMEL